MDSLIQDVRFAIRTLLKNPGFTLVAVLTLALGIGGNSAIFSAAEGIWLRPLPFTDLSRVVDLGQRTTRSSWYSVAPATYREWRDHNHSFAAVTAYRNASVTLTGAATPQHLAAARVDDGFFSFLQMPVALGRTFSTDEIEPGHDVAVLSYGLWQSQFGGREDAIGRTVQLDGKPVTIIGVVAHNADFPMATDIWLPLAFTPAEWSDSQGHPLHPLGRLRPDVSLEQASSDLDTLLGEVAQRAPKDYEGVRSSIYPLRNIINGSMTPGFLRVLLGAAGFVLLIACINLGNLQLARATGRRREFSLRAALGCSRPRLARQMLTESMILALAGAGAGLVLAEWAVRLMVTTMPPDTARQIAGWSQMQIDSRVLLFTAAAAVISGLLAGLVPVARGYRFAPAEALKAGGTTTQSASHRLRSLLVVGEAALALMLLVATVLVAQGFRNLLADAQRFAPSSLLTMEVELPAAKYPTPQARAAFYEQALSSLRSIPGAGDAAVFTSFPFSNNGVEWRSYRTSDPEGSGRDPRRLPRTILLNVSPGYFQALHIPLLSGRDFSDSDGPTSLRVAIISDVLARRLVRAHGSESRATPIGQTIFLRDGERGASGAPGNEIALTVVGVASGVEYDWTNNAPEAAIYVPFRQQPPATALFGLRAAVAPSTLVPTVRARIAQLDPDLPLGNLKTLDRLMLESMAGLAQLGGLMSSFGLIALLLAAAGMYGLVSYTVAQRTQEIGIRMAIGAEGWDVVRLIVGQMMRFAFAGAVIGVVGAVAMGRVISGFFFGASARDPLPFVLAFLLLIAMALLASFGPARRATHVDPMLALRTE